MGCTQRVIVYEVITGWQTVTSEAPQGSILGLVLFSVFINDLDAGVKFSEFDDVKLVGLSIVCSWPAIFRGKK